MLLFAATPPSPATTTIDPTTIPIIAPTERPPPPPPSSSSIVVPAGSTSSVMSLDAGPGAGVSVGCGSEISSVLVRRAVGRGCYIYDMLKHPRWNVEHMQQHVFHPVSVHKWFFQGDTAVSEHGSGGF